MAARQLGLLRHAPKLDSTGLHATDCACVRCEAGYRPTSRQRWDAAQAQKRQRAAEAAAKAQGTTVAEASAAETRKAEAAARTTERLNREAAETAARLKLEAELRAKCRPLTGAEIDELRTANGLRPRKGRP